MATPAPPMNLQPGCQVANWSTKLSIAALSSLIMLILVNPVSFEATNGIARHLHGTKTPYKGGVGRVVTWSGALIHSLLFMGIIFLVMQPWITKTSMSVDGEKKCADAKQAICGVARR